MSDTALWGVGLTFLMPLGYALIAVGGLSEDRARQASLGMLAALGLATLAYFGCGFALQFGGVGLAYNRPGLEGLIWEWSALGTTWGTGWGMVGLVGWGLTGPAASSSAYALALANLPWVVTAALIPLISLRGRVPAWAAGLVGLLVGAVLYPLAGNWIWGGGWLANLGSNLNQGHGLIDIGGAGQVHLLGATAALAGILVFLPRRSSSAKRGEPIPLPPVHLPLLAVLGAGLLLVGGPAWMLLNPLMDLQALDLSRMALNSILAAAAAVLVPLLYTWFVVGTADPLMAVRGLAAGTIAILSAAAFVPPWAALAIGVSVGLLTPLAVFAVDRVLRWDDPTAGLTVHGLGAIIGLLAIGLFADGNAGIGWNGVGAGNYLGVARQGVTGFLAGTGFQPDWPGQMQAQVVGIVTLALFGFFGTWLFLAPLSLLGGGAHRRPPRAIAQTQAGDAVSSPGGVQPMPDPAMQEWGPADEGAAAAMTGEVAPHQRPELSAGYAPDQTRIPGAEV